MVIYGLLFFPFVTGFSQSPAVQRSSAYMYPAPLALVSSWDLSLLNAYNKSLTAEDISSEMRSELDALSVLTEANFSVLMEKGIRGGEYVVEPRHSALSISEIRTLLARESIILLRNHNNMLPLNRDDKMSLAVMGPMADRALPGWPGAQGPTLLELIRAKATPGVDVRYVQGADLLEDSPSSNELILAAVPVSRQVDMTIICVGATDVASIAASAGRLPVPQEKLIRAIYQATPNIILVVISPRPVSIDYASTRISGILASWSPGQDGAAALADVIFGDYNPAGRMPCVLPRMPDPVPSVHNADPVFKVYTPSGPLYPLGFGLSYTRFEYSDVRFVRDAAGDRLSVRITNSGKLDGDEVVQLYKDAPEGPELLDFLRVPVAAKASEIVTFKVNVPSKSRLLIGSSMDDIRVQYLVH